MVTTKTAIVDKNGKGTHVHKNISGKGDAAKPVRVASLGAPKASVKKESSKPVVEVSPKLNKFTINGVSVGREFDYYSRRSAARRIPVRWNSKMNKFMVYKPTGLEYMDLEDVIPYIENTFGEEYHARLQRQREEHNAAEEEREAEEARAKNKLEEDIYATPGLDHEKLETYIKTLTDAADQAGYERGRDDGYDAGLNAGYSAGYDERNGY